MADFVKSVTTADQPDREPTIQDTLSGALGRLTLVADRLSGLDGGEGGVGIEKAMPSAPSIREACEGIGRQIDRLENLTRWLENTLGKV